MIQITKEELVKLARAAQLTLSEEEIPGLIKRLESVLSYAGYLQEFEDTGKILPLVSNVMRNDVAKESSPDQLLALAPEVEEHLYVVPAILKQ
jgi:aspartyl/glutamyl-tRNA(Asn/Gln) amidotransferase C subunit